MYKIPDLTVKDESIEYGNKIDEMAAPWIKITLFEIKQCQRVAHRTTVWPAPSLCSRLRA